MTLASVGAVILKSSADNSWVSKRPSVSSERVSLKIPLTNTKLVSSLLNWPEIQLLYKVMSDS